MNFTGLTLSVRIGIEYLAILSRDWSVDFLTPGISHYWAADNVFKVRQFQNEFMKSSFLPKYKQKIVKISAFTTQGRNPDNFLFVFWEKRWLNKLSYLYLYFIRNPWRQKINFKNILRFQILNLNCFYSAWFASSWLKHQRRQGWRSYHMP